MDGGLGPVMNSAWAESTRLAQADSDPGSLVPTVFDGLVLTVFDSLVPAVFNGLVPTVCDRLVPAVFDGLVLTVCDGLVPTVCSSLVPTVFDGLVFFPLNCFV